LGAVPALFIIKNRSTAGTEWPVKTNQLSTNSYLYLNGTNAAGSYSFFWSNDPTSSVIYLGSDNRTNGSGNSMVCYAFAEVAGYSKFGSYTGNGSTDGPFVYTGFKPRFILVKASSGTSAASANWLILDTARDTANVATAKLAANLASAENGGSIGTSAENTYDFLSAGFKPRTTNGSSNEDYYFH
jgi:hypothetical protein